MAAGKDKKIDDLMDQASKALVRTKYFEAEPLVQDVAKALEVGTTPYTLTFFEQINSPQGPWLQALQRAYYTDDNIDTIISDAKQQMKDISCA